MPLRTVFTDIGGVILTNGWDSQARNRAILFFELEKEEVGRRHDLYFPILEMGKISLPDYLDAVIFYKERLFSQAEFLEFMHSQSQPLPGMKEALIDLKNKYGFRLFTLSNESAELARWRYKTFQLWKLCDAYLVSGFVGYRKPDPAFYKLALDLAQNKLEEVLYIDDRLNLVEAARKLGIPSWHHTTVESTIEHIIQKNSG